MLPWQCFCQGALEKMFLFFRKKWYFLAQKVSISGFLVQILNQGLKIDPCATCRPDWTKDKEARISTWKNIKKMLDDVMLTS